jgi:glycosyltransferase involved in cell wall biosynthesis
MHTKPLISCVTIFLNGEQYIREAIESVFSQNYEHWELLLVDDGSTDSSTQIALHYAQQYPDKVHYLEHPGHQNRGMSATRNLGIRHAQGEYLAFLDADDIWLPQKLEHQVAILETHPEAGMVYGPTLMWYGWTAKSEDKAYERQRDLGVPQNTLVYPPKLLSLCLQRKAESPATSSFLIRRALIETIGGFEESFRGMYEDQAFLAKVLLRTPVFADSQCTDYYRQHTDSFCSKAKSTGQWHPFQPNPTYLVFLNWLAEYIATDNQSIEVKQALRKAIWPYHHPHLYRLWVDSLQLLRYLGKWALPDSLRRSFLTKFGTMPITNASTHQR